MTELDMVLKAVEAAEGRLRGFAMGSEIHPDDYQIAVHDAGAFQVLAEELRSVRARETP